VRQRGLECVHRAAEEHREHPVPLRTGDLGDVEALLVVARRRNHEVESAEAVCRGVDRRADQSGVGHVETRGQVGV
jgi:hypothetical protein